MTNIKAGLIFLAVLLAGLQSFEGIAASATWDNTQIWNALVYGEHDLSLSTSMENSITIEDGSISKDVLTSLNAINADQVQLKSVSILTTTDGSHISTIQNSISQTYNLPREYALIISNLEEISGFPENPVSYMSGQTSIIDANTGVTLATFLSSSQDNQIKQIINAILADAGLGVTIDDLQGLKGSVQYSTELTDTNNGITASWGEAKNLPVQMIQSEQT
ncbi:MAG: hypothetical protein ACE14P_11990 [Methanotrichaceae archaeon]